MSSPSDFSRRLFSWLRLAAVGLMCVVTSASRIGGAQTPDGGRWIEFDVKEQGSAINGFVVGYFGPGKSEPAFVFRVPSARAQPTRRGVVRLPLINGAVPAGGTFVMRIQTVVGRMQSEWSEPSPSFTVSASEAQAAAKVTPEKTSRKTSRSQTPGTRSGGSAADALDRNPALRDRLSALFPGRNLAQDAVGFREVRDLVAALNAATNLKIPFEEIKRLTAGAGSLNLEKAIAQLRPGADGKAAARRAQRQARRTLIDTRKKQSPRAP